MQRPFAYLNLFIAAALLAGCDVNPLIPWKGWAAFVVSADSSLGMGWGATAEEAEEQAKADCRKRSLACAEVAALTNRASDKAAHICCNLPEKACAIGLAPSSKEAIKNVEQFVETQEWSRCFLRGVYFARSGLPMEF